MRLEDLDVQDNQTLVHISPSLANAINLKRVNLRNIRMEMLPPNLIRNWNSLLELSIRDNPQIDTLPVTISRLTELKRLDLNGCSLNQLPEEIGQLKHLMVLDLRRNQLTSASFPEQFGNLGCLTRLFLRYFIRSFLTSVIYSLI